MLSFSVDDVENVELAPTDVMRIYSSILIKENNKEEEHEMKEIKKEKNNALNPVGINSHFFFRFRVRIERIFGNVFL